MSKGDGGTDPAEGVLTPSKSTSKRSLLASHYVALIASLTDTRLLCTALGVGALCVLGFIGEGALADGVAQVALVALGLATVSGFWQLTRSSQAFRPPRTHRENSSFTAWLFVALAVGLAAALGMQTWFQSGKSIGTGDIPPPEGTAWLGRLFDPWIWTGSNLGEPSVLPSMLPWAVILGAVHALGGHADLAQRFWYTGLFVGASLSGLTFMAALRMSPTAALVGASIYVLNPYVVTVVNIYPNYIAALAMLPALPAVLLFVGSGRLSVRNGAIFIAASAPILGYTFSNPPLVGMILTATLATPLLAAWVYGEEAASRSLRGLLLAIPILLAASAYWMVAVILHLSGLSGDQLANLASWTWTEGRASIRNALWLNNFWAWKFPEYFPYSSAYESVPLSIARFALPAIAFGALGLRQLATYHVERAFRDRLLRLAVAAAAVALLTVFLSTGTNPPGSLLFNRLYGLPFGWLIREPGRFLMVAALAYAVLIAVVADALVTNRSVVDLGRGRRLSIRAIGHVYVPVAIGISLLLGFPLYTGAVATDDRPKLPPSHVRVPNDWTAMAHLVDGLTVQGNLLVMPPDDFYAMPYKWGYYGSDGFVVELFHRPVLVPNPQGYTPTSNELISAVDLTAQSILHHDWGQAEALATAMHTPLVLVRRDIESLSAGRTILSPTDLVAALDAAPNFVLVSQIGSLDLFVLRSTLSDPEITGRFVTINSRTPDLRILSLLSPGTALISSQPLMGAPRVDMAPPPEQWQIRGDSLEWRTFAPSGSRYRIADLDAGTAVSLDRSGTFAVDNSTVRVAYALDGSDETITASVLGRTVISNGDFAGGPWEPMSACNGVPPARPNVDTKVIPKGAPGGFPAIQLTALLDTACESQSLTWQGGLLVVNLMVRHVEGASPRICLWEFGVNHCASLPAIRNEIGWTQYRAAVTPEAGTTGLSIRLYADRPTQGGRTITEYANVRVVEVSALPALVLQATPVGQPSSSQRVAVLHNSYSDAWVANNGRHVVVDGMLNGWLIQPGSGQFTARYEPSGIFTAAQWVSLGTLLLVFGLSASRWIRHLSGRLGMTSRTGILGRKLWRRLGRKLKP